MVKNPKNKIHADMTIAEILEIVPESAVILADFQLGCAHCAMGAVETLREGVLGHGKDEDELSEIEDQLNKIVSKPRNFIDIEGILFTEEAYDKVLEFMKNDPKERKNLALRIQVLQEEDFSYYFDLVDKKDKNDIELKEGNLTVYISKEGKEHFEGRFIDYIDTAMGSGFKVRER
jgi:hybrid cluster-associated redox disulfide protein